MTDVPPVLYALPYPRFFSQHRGVGGHVAHVRGVLDGFVRAGLAVEVVAEEDHETLRSPGVRVSVLPLGSSSLVRRQLWGGRFVSHLGSLVRGAPRALCYMRYSAGFAAWIASAARALRGVPLILEINSLGSQRHRWMRRMDKHALRSVDLIVCVSESLRDFISETLDPELVAKTAVVPNGVDVERFACADITAARAERDRIDIGFAGLLKPDYGLLELAGAFELVMSRYPKAALHIYGDGPFRSVLDRRLAAVRAAGGHATLHEPVPFQTMPRILAALDVLVYTTSEKYRFQSPIKLLEYMAAGKPIVAADTPQVRQLLDEGSLGILFKPGDVSAMAAAIGAVIEDSNAARERAVRASAVVRARHTWTHRIGDILEALEKAVPNRYSSTNAEIAQN